MGRGDERLRHSRLVKTIGIIPIVFSLCFFVLPLGNVARAVATTIGGGATTALGTQTWATLQLAATSALQALASAVLTLAVGLPLTAVLARREFPGRRLLTALVTVPFILPTVVTGLALRQATSGWLEPGLALLLLGHVYVNLAVVQRLVGPVWAALDGRLLLAAAALGANRWQVLRTVTLPLLRPAIRRAGAIVFAYTFGSLGLVLLLGGRTRTLETQVLRQVSLLLDFPGAAVTALLQLLVVRSVLALATRDRLHRATLAARPGGDVRRPLRHGAVFAAVVSALLLAPLAGLVPSSLRGSDGWTLQWWADAVSLQGLAGVSAAPAALFATVRTATATGVTAAVLAVAVGVAVLLPRWRWLGRLSALPLAVSASTLGLGLLLTFGRAPLDWRGSWWLLPLAHTLAALPLTTALTIPLITGLDARRVVVASTLGATPLRAFVTAYGPACGRAGVHAAAVGAAVSLGEFGAASFLGAYDHATLPVSIMRLLAHPGAQSLGVAAVMALLLTACAIALVSVIARLEGNRS